MWDGSRSMKPPTSQQDAAPCPVGEANTSFPWTLAKCTVIILLGFLAGRFGFIRGREVKGLDLFTSHICLSSLIFLNLSQLNLRAVEWEVIFGILCGKVVLFSVVVAVMVVLGRPGNLANAGLYAVFVTQVNDFGLAYPLVDSVYKKSHPEYSSYMYLVAPMSLVLLNPLGFFLVEAEVMRTKMRRNTMDGEKTHLSKQLLLSASTVFLRVCSHPHVWASVLAVAVNVLRTRGKLPLQLTSILKVMGDAFAAPILFLLGYYIAKSCHGSTLKKHLFGAIALAAVKSVLLPLLMKLFVDMLTREKRSTSHGGAFAFLYGTVPTAPIVILYASQRGLPTETLAAGIGLCTMLSTPLMFVSANVISTEDFGILEPPLQLKTTLAVISGISLAASVYVVLFFYLTGRIYKFISSILFCLLLSEILKSIGVLLWFATLRSSVAIYLVMFLVTTGQYASRIWTACLAVNLFLLKHYKTEELMSNTPLMFLFGHGIPVILTAIVIILGRFVCRSSLLQSDLEMPFFFNGDCEAVTTVLVLSFCSSLVAFSMLQHTLERTLRRFRKVVLSTNDGDNFTRRGKNVALTGVPTGNDESSLVQRSRSAVPARVRFQLPPSGEVIWPGHEEVPSSSDETEALHTNEFLLLILLFVSMIIGVLVSYWKLFVGSPRGVMRAVEFLDMVLSFGQGIFLLFACGLDTKLLSEAKLWIIRAFHKEGATFAQKKVNHLDDIDVLTCERFLAYHHNSFEVFLEKGETVPASLKGVPFHGHRMVDWLLDAGLVGSRQEAVIYGRRLLAGAVIAHEQDELHFYDGPYTYFLLPRREE